MTRILLILVFILTGIIPAQAADGDANPKVWINPQLPHELNLNVWVEQTKTDEMPWDGCPHTFMQSPVNIMGLMGNAFHPSPPEIRLMILRSNGSMTHHQNAACNDTLKCDFRKIPVKNEVVGFLLFDADASMRDLIDAMVLVPEKSQKWKAPADKMRKRMKKMVSQFTPEIPDLCRMHVASRRIEISPFAYDECPSGSVCELSQSSWSYSTGEAKPNDEWDWR